MKALAIAGTNLRRLLRERANVFFLFVLPMLIILLLGAAFGTAALRLGIVAEGRGPLGEGLVVSLVETENLAVERYADEAALERAVERGRVQAGLVVPAGYDDAVRGRSTVEAPFFARPDSSAQELRLAVQSALAEQAVLLRTARFLEGEGLANFDEGLAAARQVSALVPPVGAAVTASDGAPYPETGGRFDRAAGTQLVLFIFLTSLTGAAALVETRRLGVSRRMLATPTSSASILLGEALGRFAVALVQAAIIMGGATLFFRVDWGDPLAVAALVTAFCLVGSGAGMLLGSTLGNEQQAGAVSLLVGLGLAALGGSMVPLEVFPDAMRTVAHATPHAWANEAFSELLRHRGGLADIAPQLAVLAAFAGALLTAATWRLRRAVTG